MTSSQHSTPTLDELKQLINHRFEIIDEQKEGEFDGDDAENATSRHACCVRYVGTLQTSERYRHQIWVGVEWDDETRGKHDGQAYGQRLFTTRDGKPRASFLMLEKFQRCAQPRLDVAQAIRKRYLQGLDMQSGDNDAVVLVNMRSGSGKVFIPVQFVGKEKTERRFANALDSTTKLCLASMGIALPSNELSTLCPKLQELDLSYNLIHSWRQVLDIIRLAPNSLHTIQLTGNRLEDFSYTTEYENLIFPGIKTLALNFIEGISWKQVAQLKRTHFPNLETLHLDHCAMSRLDEDVAESNIDCSTWSTLKILDLSYNAFEQWESLCCLARLPSLEKLLLNANRLTQVTFPAGFQNSFSNLKILLLGQNKIARWSSVDELNKFPVLEEVRLDENPLVATDVIPQQTQQALAQPSNASELLIDLVRLVIVAKIKDITILNGSQVFAAERRDNERYYLKQCAAEKQVLSPEAFAAKHPRYEDLVKLYGDPLEGVSKQTQAAGPKKCKMISVTFEDKTSSATEGKTQFTKKLLPTSTVFQLKQLCQRSFKLDPKAQRLILQTRAGDQIVEEVMDEDSREISFYGADGEVVVHVHELDTALESSQAQQRDRDLAERLRQQEREAIAKQNWQRNQFK